MSLGKRKLYTILIIACVAGYIWLYFGISANETNLNSMEVCVIKHVTNIPCPSCGSTRSVISLIKGNFTEALLINPLGYIIALIMLLTPPWILFDLTTGKKTLLEFYQKIELELTKAQFAIPLIMLVVVNWIWNITKGL